MKNAGRTDSAVPPRSRSVLAKASSGFLVAARTPRRIAFCAPIIGGASTTPEDHDAAATGRWDVALPRLEATHNSCLFNQLRGALSNPYSFARKFSDQRSRGYRGDGQRHRARSPERTRASLSTRDGG